MNDMIFLQANGLPSALLEFKDFLLWLEYLLPKLLNGLLIIWIVAVFFTWRMVSSRSIIGFFWGLFQSFLVYAVEEQLVSSEDAKFLLGFCTVINLILLFSPGIAAGALATRFYDSFLDAFNAVKNAFITLFFSCMTFIILDKPYSLSNFYDLFAIDNFIKAILPIYVCWK